MDALRGSLVFLDTERSKQMGKLRFDCYQEFAKRIEFPVVAFWAETGEVTIMNYEAKLMLGQKTETISILLDRGSDIGRFWTQLHDRKAVAEHQLILSNGMRNFPVRGLVNEFEVDDKQMYMVLFDQRSGFGSNSWMLERMIENSNVIVAYMSFEGLEEIKLNYISRNIKRYGYTVEEFYTGKMQFKDLIHPDDFDEIMGSFAERAKDGRDDDGMEYRIVTESRKVCYVRCNVHFLRDAQGKIEGMEAVMIDITGEKLEKDENQYLRSAIEQSKNVVLVKRFLNKKGSVKYVSSNAVGLGLDVEDLRKGRKTFTDYILPEDRQMVTDILMNAQNIPVSNYMNRCRVRGEDGIVRWIKFCISVKTIDEYMYDVELLMSDATQENDYEQNLLQTRRELEEKLEYVMSNQISEAEWKLEDFLQEEDLQKFMEAFAVNNQLYTVIIDRHGKALTTPTGPMNHLGEFYDMLERPQYRDKLETAWDMMNTKRKFTILGLEDDSFEKQIGMVPIVKTDDIVASCLVCAFGEEAVSRLHNAIDSLQTMITMIIQTGFNNRYLELDSKKSRLAERVMSEELEGQLILARAFAHMKNDANATIQEIIDKACGLLHMTSILIYCGELTEEAYVCMAKSIMPDAFYKDFPDHSWRMAEICRTNDIVASGGYIIYDANEKAPQLKQLASQTHSGAVMAFGILVNEKLYGGMIFTSQEKRVFHDREIAYCRDVVDIIQGILERDQNAHHVYELNRDLLRAYNFVSDCVFVKDNQTGQVLFANEAMETLFGIDVTGMDSHTFLSVPAPLYTREGIRPIGDIKWQSYIGRINKIMNIQEISIKWQNGEDAKMVIMRENSC